MYNAALSGVRVIVVAVGKKWDKYYIFWVCVCVSSLSYPALKKRMRYYIVIFGLSGCIKFFHIILQTARLSGKSCWKQNACFVFLYNSCQKKFLIKKNSERHYHKCAHVVAKSFCYSCQLRRNSNFMGRFSKNTDYTKFHENQLSRSRVVPCGRTDGHTHWQTGMTKLTVALRKSVTVPKTRHSVLTQDPLQQKYCT